jgi:molybdopterin-binding protein
MTSIDVYLKVEVDLGEGETTERVTQEIVRTLERLYGVRRAEVTSVITHAEP